ncbi:MAG: transcriptional regulator [Thermoplasmata archaeon]|nr:transcriptional regulator [Thermoplasmata archaeon]
MNSKRYKILNDVRQLLADCGFYVTDPINLKGISFDLIARRDDQLLILKILQNIDAFGKEDANQMRKLASALSGSPAVVGSRTSSKKLGEGIIYSRFGIPILSFDTLQEFMKEGVPPFIFAAPGGLYVKIDSDLLRTIRREKNISLGALAEIAGVSRKAIQMYEEGMGTMIEIAIRMEEFLNEPLVLPLNPFEYGMDIESISSDVFEDNDLLHEDIFRLLSSIGYSVLPTARCPFEAITTDDKIFLLTGVERYGPMLERKARAVTSISKVVEKKAVIITDKDSHLKSLRKTPLICRDELAKMRDRQKILEIIRERSED